MQPIRRGHKLADVFFFHWKDSPVGYVSNVRYPWYFNLQLWNMDHLVGNVTIIFMMIFHSKLAHVKNNNPLKNPRFYLLLLVNNPRVKNPALKWLDKLDSYRLSAMSYLT